jgi:hypothetical protein
MPSPGAITEPWIQAHRLEHMADIRHLTRSGASASRKPDDYEIAAERNLV